MTDKLNTTAFIMDIQLHHPIPAPAYSMARKYSPPKPPSTPGPGAYNPINTFRSTPKALLLGSNDSFFHSNDLPGPGQYEETPCKTKGIKFSREARCKTNENLTPGPAAYDLNFSIFSSSPKYVMSRAKQPSPKPIKTVEPGSYNIPSKLRTDLGYKIPKYHRSTHVSTHPGPADYGDIQYRPRRGIKIGRSPRSLAPTLQGPGPADYSPLTNGEHSPRPVIGKAQRVEKIRILGPGPGEYDIAMPKGPKFSFPKGRDVVKIDKNPLTYITEYSSLRKTAIVFPRSTRTTRVSDVPGPGSYTLEGFFGRLGDGELSKHH